MPRMIKSFTSTIGVFALLFCSIPTLGPNGYSINNAAGASFPEGAVATSISIGSVTGLATTPGGDVFLSSYNMARIFHVTPTGQIFTYARSPVSLVFDDLLYPAGLAFDRLGNLFVASFDNNYLKRIDPSGAIANAAGTGFTFLNGNVPPIAQPTVVAVDSNNTVFVNSEYGGTVVEVSSQGIISLLPTLGVPNGIAVDPSGSIYIADSSNHQIRRYDLTGSVRTVAGTGTPGFSGDGASALLAQLQSPRSLALDPEGNLYIADAGNSRIRKVDVNGVISSVHADALPCYNDPTSSCFGPSLVLAVDGSGNLFSNFCIESGLASRPQRPRGFDSGQ